MNKECDKCGSEILEDQCSCGYWYEKNELPNFIKIMEKAIFAYDHMCEQSNSDDPFSGNHYTGNCVVFFKGDYEDCQNVKNYIKNNVQKR